MPVFYRGPYDPKIEEEGYHPTISTVDVPPGYRGKLAYSQRGGLRILDLETGEYFTFKGVAGMVCPTWSPDGKKLAYMLDSGDAHEIWTLDIASGEKRLLGSGTYWKGKISWSPDSKRIAYSLYQSGAYDIWIMDADGTGGEKVTSGDAWEITPVWRPDGGEITYVSDVSGYYELWSMPLHMPPVPLPEAAPAVEAAQVGDPAHITPQAVPESHGREEREKQDDMVLELAQDPTRDLRTFRVIFMLSALSMTIISIMLSMFWNAVVRQPLQLKSIVTVTLAYISRK